MYACLKLPILISILSLTFPLFPDDPDPPLEIDYQKDYNLYTLETRETTPERRNFMTGDWGGSRTYLHNQGMDILSSYVTDMLANIHGGRARGFGYTGSLGLAVTLDFDQALKRKTGLTFYTSANWRTGTNLSSRKIDNEFSVSQLYGFETVLLTELYLKESVRNGTLIIKAGRLCTGNDFLVSPLYGLYVNNAFDGNPVGVFYNFPAFTAYPAATWGLYLSFQPIEQLVVKAAVYNANVNILQNKFHGINFTFSSTNGVIWITEWDVLVNQKTENSKWPSNYKAGFIYQTGNANHCWYLLVDQAIYQKGKQRFTPFAALLFAPSEKNMFPFFMTSGLVCEALFQSRPRDTTNFGIAYGRYSVALAPKNSETILELNHWFQINDWWTFTPDIQYIITPKGLASTPNALVIGFQMGFIL